MQIRSIVVNLFCVAAGLLVGSVMGGWGPHEPQSTVPAQMLAVVEQPSPACSPVASPRSPTIQGGDGLNLEDIRGIVREELMMALSSGPSGIEKPSEDEPRQEDREILGEQRQRAHDEATQLLKRAMLNGSWTNEDRQAFRLQVESLSIPQQDALIGELFTAIQSGRLRLDGAGPPL